jgi:hypothetical protein
MLSPTTRVALLALLALCIAAGVRFHGVQNVRKARGGPISGPKLAWLLYAVFLWFLVCPVAALDSGIQLPLRGVLGAFAAFMWLRGLVELYMLYVSHNWRPPYGITHDVACIALVLGGLVAFPPARPLAAVDLWAAALVALVLVSLAVEVLYAALFFRAVEGRTTGEEGVWFADEEDPRYRRINRITLALNVPLYSALAMLLGLALVG